MFSFLYHCQDFYRTWLYTSIARRVSYQKQKLLTIREHLTSALFFSGVRVMFVFVCLCLLYHILPVSLDCLFLIARSVLSNVYLVLSEYTTIILHRFFFKEKNVARSVIVYATVPCNMKLTFRYFFELFPHERIKYYFELLPHERIKYYFELFP